MQKKIIKCLIFTICTTSLLFASKNDSKAINSIEKLLQQSDLKSCLEKLNKKDQSFPLNDFKEIKTLIWEKYKTEIKNNKQRQKELKEKAIEYNGKKMKYVYDKIGKASEKGYPLYIALHGGGGAPARVNDSQYKHMQTYYKGGVKNGIYLAARGVTNTWHLHWVPESFVCYDRIIENMIVFENVDPNRVYLMGFSAGGDACYQIPAKAPDRYAAAAMSAGHPNGVKMDNISSLPLLIQLGEYDKAYKRNTVAAEYGEKIKKLRAEHPNYYINNTYIHINRGHNFVDYHPKGKPQTVYANAGEWLKKGTKAKKTMVNTNSIHWLNQHTRKPYPTKIIWNTKIKAHRSGDKENKFWPSTEKGNLNYWVGIDRYRGKNKLETEKIVVELDKENNFINVFNIGNFLRIYLHPEILDLSKNISVTVGSSKIDFKPRLSLAKSIQSLLDRGDTYYIFPASFELIKENDRWKLNQ